MGVVTVEVKNFFNKESVLWKYQQRTLSVEVKWNRSARNLVFPASASPHLCWDLSRQCAFLQFWPWDRDNLILWNSLEEAENAPLFRIELSSLCTGTRLPSGGIPGCLRIVFNLFVATRPLFLSHTLMASMNTTRKMPSGGHFPHFLKWHFGAQNSNGITISWNIPHVVVKMAPETTFGSYWTLVARKRVFRFWSETSFLHQSLIFDHLCVTSWRFFNALIITFIWNEWAACTFSDVRASYDSTLGTSNARVMFA